MQLVDLTPITLAQWPGFPESVERVRAEAELPLFSDGSAASYDVAEYQQLYELGVCRCVAVVGDNDKLLGWGLVMHLVTPRRKGGILSTDVMWADNPRAGGLILAEFRSYAEARGCPLFVTAKAGGRLDQTMSRRRLPTHRTYVFNDTIDTAPAGSTGTA